MFLINFEKTSSQAFVHGFVKGLGAPVMLFHHEVAPGLPSVFQVIAPNMPIDRVLAGDWYRVGGDIRSVIARHEVASGIIIGRPAANKHVKQSRKPIKKSRSKSR